MEADRLTILAIDDIQDNLTTLKAVIRDTFPEARVLTAQDGPAGIELALAEDPDVILLDIVMPGMDGFEVCRRLKADKWLQLIPVVFLTAQQGDRQSRIKALEIGGEAFLTKPIEEAELTAQIRAMAKIKAATVHQRQEKERLAVLVTDRTRELNLELAGHRQAELARQQALEKLQLSQNATLNLLEDLKSENEARKKTEEQLSRAKDEWERTFDAVPDLICLLNDQHTILRVNQAMADKLGVHPKAAVGLKCYQCVHGLEAPPDFCPHARLLEDQQPHDEDVHEDRLGGYFHITCTPLHDKSGRLLGSVHVARDITASKLATQALRDSETLLREAQTVASLGSYSLNVATGQWTSSGILDQIFGVDADSDRSVEGWQALIHPDDRQMMRDYLASEVIGKHGRFNKEYRIIRKNDGVECWVHGMGKLEIDAQDRVIRMFGTIQDITERKRAEKELLESRVLTASIVDSTIDLIWSVDPEYFGLMTFNHALIEHFFKRDNRLITVGDRPEDIQSPKHAELWYDLYRRALKEGPYTVEVPSTKGDRIREVSFNILRRDETVFGISVFAKDITARKQAEEALQLTRFSLEHVSDGLFWMTPDARIVDVNEAACRSLGYVREELLNLIIPDIDPHYDAAIWRQFFAELRQRGSLTFETEHRTKDGRIIAVEIVANHVQFGSEERSCAIVRDITERKRVEETRRQSEERHRAILQTAMDGFWTVDRQGRLLEVNEAYCRISGYSMPELLTMSISELEANQTPDDIAATIQKIQELGEVRFESRHRRKDGSVFDIEASVQYRPADNQIVAFVRDITERKRAEDELLLHREHLEELVGQRTAELAEARDQAQAANRAKSAFLANMSHELRTPLTAILGFAQIMAREPDLPAQEQRNLDIILRSGEHLLSLINDILDLSKIDAGRSEVDLHEVDLDALFHDVVNMMRIRADAKGLSLFLDIAAGVPRHVCSDSGKLRQIIINLVGNAIKFTPAGQITIRLAAESLPAGWRLAVEIEDTGIGIAKKDQGRLFQPFEQIGTRTTEGTGLGLAITRKYVQMLGGEIMLDSEPGKGSCFRFTILAGRSDAEACSQPAGRKPVGIKSPTADLRLLIVEDQPENRLLLRCFLDPLGFQLCEAVNGEEAIDIFQQWRPQLILMDRRMPVLDGLEATRRIRALPGGDRPVIIAVSAHSFKEEQQEMRDAGCNDFNGKPFNGENLLELLSRHLHLELVYASGEDSLPPVPRQLSADDLRELSPEALATLHRLAFEGDDLELAKWLKTQEGLAPAVREGLATLISNYRFEVIQEITGSK